MSSMVAGEEIPGLVSQDLNPTLPCTSYITLHKVINLMVLQFPHI